VLGILFSTLLVVQIIIAEHDGYLGLYALATVFYWLVFYLVMKRNGWLDTFPMLIFGLGYYAAFGLYRILWFSNPLWVFEQLFVGSAFIAVSVLLFVKLKDRNE
jgi:hypothetical protein